MSHMQRGNQKLEEGPCVGLGTRDINITMDYILICTPGRNNLGRRERDYNIDFGVFIRVIPASMVPAVRVGGRIIGQKVHIIGITESAVEMNLSGVMPMGE